MKRMLAVTALAAMFTAPAVSADLVLADIPVVYSSSSAYDWTGFYVGVGVGYNWSQSNTEFVNPALAAVPVDMNPSGFVGEIHAGYNHQLDLLVLGIEGSIGIGGVSGTIDDPLIAMGVAPAGSTVTATSDVNWALLGKAGLALDRFMPYVTAGVVGAHSTTTATAGGADDSGWFTGFAVGGGLELAVTEQLSVRGQYLYSRLSGPNFNSGQAFETASSPANSTFTLGVNYRF